MTTSGAGGLSQDLPLEQVVEQIEAHNAGEPGVGDSTVILGFSFSGSGQKFTEALESEVEAMVMDASWQVSSGEAAAAGCAAQYAPAPAPAPETKKKKKQPTA